MQTHATPTEPSRPTGPRGDRHRLVDVLRGVALLGILFVNVEFMVQHLDVGWSGLDGAADVAVRALVVGLGQTKVYPLFALLFGYGLAMQLVSAERKGVDHAPQHRRRMLGLVVLGLVHGIVFFPGDILLIYGLVGLAAHRLRDRDDRSLLRIAGVTYGAAALLWLAVGVLELGTGSSAAVVPAAEVAVLSDGSFADVVAQHARYWPFTQLLLFAVQGPAVVAYYLVGIVVGRSDLLARPERHADLARTVLRWVAPPALWLSALGAWLTLAGGGSETLGFAVGFLAAPAMAATYLAAIARLVGSAPGPLGRLCETAGRASLTVYLLESVVVTTVAYGYGLGWFGLRPLAGVALAVGTWLVLALAVRAWLRVARQGPFEWLLRTVTHGERQRLLR